MPFGPAKACSRAARFAASPVTAPISSTAPALLVADHNEPGRNADAHPQIHIGKRSEITHSARPLSAQGRARRAPPARHRPRGPPGSQNKLKRRRRDNARHSRCTSPMERAQARWYVAIKSRRSSGSSRVDRPTESTRSQNMIVSCRLSARSASAASSDAATIPLTTCSGLRLKQPPWESVFATRQEDFCNLVFPGGPPPSGSAAERRG